MENVAERTARIIRTRLGLAGDQSLTRDMSMLDLGADSLDGVEILLALETEFECKIPDSAAEHMLTLGDLLDYLDPPSTVVAASDVTAAPLALDRVSP